MLPQTWTTRDGRRLPIRAMSTGHVANAIGMCAARHQRVLDRIEFPQLTSPATQANAEREFYTLQSSGPEFLWPVYDTLRAELLRRCVAVYEAKGVL